MFPHFKMKTKRAFLVWHAKNLVFFFFFSITFIDHIDHISYINKCERLRYKYAHTHNNNNLGKSFYYFTDYIDELILSTKSYN